MKKGLNYFLSALYLAFVFFSCNKSAENRKSELNNDNSSSELNNVNSVRESSNVYQSQDITKEFVKSEFVKYLAKIKENHSICSYCPDKGVKIVIGDLNADNLPDAIVQYQFKLNEEDEQFGQSGIYNCVGFVMFINTEGKIDVSQKVNVIDILPYSVSESVTIKKIEDNGSIVLEKLVDRKWDDNFDSEKDEQYVTKTYKTKISWGKIEPINL